MAALSRRIVKETMRLLQEPVHGISAVPDENKARYFHVIVTGPSDSPFEGGLFKLELFLSSTANSHRPIIDSGITLGTKSLRSASQRCGRTMAGMNGFCPHACAQFDRLNAFGVHSPIDKHSFRLQSIAAITMHPLFLYLPEITAN